MRDDDSTLDRLESQLLGGPRTLTVGDVAERLGVPVEEIHLFWHALGLPTTAPDAVSFTEEDARVLGRVLRARDEFEIGPRTGVSLVRSIGHTTDRLVLWQVEALVEHVSDRYGLDDTSARLVVIDRLGEIAPLLEDQLVYAWRRQLAAVAARFAAEFAESRSSAPSNRLPLARAVGFADVVSFTARTAGLGSHELSDFVQQFEARSRDVVTSAGGRVVKTIGDAVLFVADDPTTGARIALGLAETIHPEVGGPVRVSMVWGRVLSRFGDVFGPSVNLAARLTEEADPGTVLVDSATAAVLAARAAVDERDGHTDGPGLELVELPARDVPGIGPVRPVQLSRSAGR